MASATQVAERFDLGRAVTYARLGGLVRLGLLEHARVFHGAPGVYLATKTGLAAVDLELPPARIDLRTYTHDLELTSLVASLNVSTDSGASAPSGDACGGRPGRGRAGRRATIRDTAGGRARPNPTHSRGTPAPPLPGLRGGPRSGETSTGMLAVELERTSKGRARLRRILAGYVAARHVPPCATTRAATASATR